MIKDIPYFSQNFSRRATEGEWFEVLTGGSNSSLTLNVPIQEQETKTPDVNLFFRVSSIEDKVKSLEEKLAEMEEFVKNKEKELKTENRLISNIKSGKIKLLSPIPIVLEITKEGVIAYSYDFDVSGMGDIDYDAINDFCSKLEEKYFKLKKYKNKLGRDLEKIWAFAKTIIKEI